MLLVHPVREVVRFLPVLLGLFVAGCASGGRPWQYLGVLVPIALGVLRYLTTRFRIAQGRVELRRGLLNRHVLSTPLDRVRTVDVTASLIHRVLGLATVRIGTGTASTDSDERLDLDGLPADRARGLRAELLHVAPVAHGDDRRRQTEPARADERVVLRFDPALGAVRAVDEQRRGDHRRPVRWCRPAAQRARRLLRRRHQGLVARHPGVGRRRGGGGRARGRVSPCSR